MFNNVRKSCFIKAFLLLPSASTVLIFPWHYRNQVARTMDSDLFLGNQVESNIPTLRKILKEKYDIYVPSQCDKFLGRCLRQKDGNIEKAVKLAQAFYQASSDFGLWNAKLDPSCYAATCHQVPILCSLATRDNLGRRVYVGQIKHWNPEIISFEEAAVAIWMLSQIGITNEEDQKHGYVVIWNIEGFSLQQAWAINQRKLLRFCKWIQGGVMGRVKGVHFIKHPKIAEWIYKGVKPFLSEKMRNRVKFHKDLTELQESIGLKPTLLAKLFESELEVGDYMDKEFVEKLLNSKEFFQEMINTRFPVE